MKHTFVLIDNLMILIKDVPPSINSPESKAVALDTLDKIARFKESLQKLIENHKDKKYLDRLHNSHIDQIEQWVDKVMRLLGKLDSLLEDIKHYEAVLREIVKDNPDKWGSKVRDFALGMVITGLHDEEEEMKRFRNIAIFEMHELKGIISAEHVAEIKHVLNLLE